METSFKPKITLFHCINTFGKGASLPLDEDHFEMRTVKMPCSGMVKDIFLLKAFESGSDAVIVMVCPEGACRHAEGNLRAKKRVEWVRNLLDEIGLGRRRLSIFNISSQDESTAVQIIRQTLSDLADLGPNPAA